MEENEIWKDILGYEGVYQVSNLGRIKSLERSWIAGNGGIFNHKEMILVASPKSGGYLTVSLHSNGKQNNKPIHRLVATHFIENKLKLKYVNHKDGNKKNNQINNLEWCTSSDNQKHAYEHNLKKIFTGAEHPNSKLVLDLGTGIYYDSCTEAASAKNIRIKNLSRMLSGERKNKTSLLYV